MVQEIQLLWAVYSNMLVEYPVQLVICMVYMFAGVFVVVVSNARCVCICFTRHGWFKTCIDCFRS